MNLSVLRKKKKLTQKELASLIGVAESTICKYENGSLHPSADKILDMAESLGDDVFKIFPCRKLSELHQVLTNRGTESELSNSEKLERSQLKLSEVYKIVTKRADYQCQICGETAPQSMDRFLELYLVNSNDELCLLDAIIAVCPNCLKKITSCNSLEIMTLINKIIQNNKNHR